MHATFAPHLDAHFSDAQISKINEIINRPETSGVIAPTSVDRLFADPDGRVRQPGPFTILCREGEASTSIWRVGVRGTVLHHRIINHIEVANVRS